METETQDPQTQITVTEASEGGEIYHYVAIPAEGGQEMMALDNSGTQENPTQYYEGEELIASALTDEDRKLAAALVDVHYKNQSQHSVITSRVIPHTTTTYTIETAEGERHEVTGYIQQEVEEGSEVYETVTGDVDQNETKEAAEYIDQTVESLSNRQLIIRGDSNQAPTRIVKAGSVPNSGKKTLPHKKRMMKLTTEQPGHTSKTYFSCNKCGDLFTSPSDLTDHKTLVHGIKKPKVVMAKPAPKPVAVTKAAPAPQPFSCQICDDSFSSQLVFFEHLKSHYESPVKETRREVRKQEPVYYESPTKVHKVEPTSDDENRAQDGGSEEYTNNDTEEYTQVQVVEKDDRGLYPCSKCDRSFRRSKALETHMSVSHPKKEEIEEFSEPEDMMEGLRHVVTLGEQEDDKSNIIIRSWSPLGTTLLETPSQSYHLSQLNPNQYTEILDSSMTSQQYDTFETINVELATGSSHDKTISVTLVPIHEASTEDDLIAASSTEDWKGTVVLLEEAEPKPKTPRGPKGPRKKREKGEKKDFVCEYCLREFKHRNTYIYHLRSHTGERPHMCDSCGKSFYSSSALKVHSRIHLALKPYPCELCGRAFRQWGDLKYHKASIHTDIKAFQCEYCGKDFARKYSLVVHRRIHTGERNYQCEFCQKSFRASSYLQNHRRIHTGEKPHFCPVCNKLFRVRSDMKRHLNTHNVDPRDYLTVTGNQTGVMVKRERVEEVVEYDQEIPAQQHRPSRGGKRGRQPAERGESPPLSSDSSDSNDMEEVTIPTTRSKRRSAPDQEVEEQHGYQIQTYTEGQKEEYVWIPAE